MRLHYPEVDLSRHARPRLATQEERDPAERVAEIERASETRGAGKLPGITVLQARSRGPGAPDQILAMCRMRGQSAGRAGGLERRGGEPCRPGAGVAIVPASLRAIRRAGVLYRPLHEWLIQLDMVWRKEAASPMLRACPAGVRKMGIRGTQPSAHKA